MTKKITLAGFGTLDEDGDRETLAAAAKKHGVEFYPTYYDHELKGTPEAIEALTQDLWSMGRDEWAENALTETPVECNHEWVWQMALDNDGNLYQMCEHCGAYWDGKGEIVYSTN